MKKIAFIGQDLKFISHIIDYFQKELQYEVKIDEWEGHEKHDEAKSLEIVEWADILFCEWGLGNVLWYQERKKAHQKLFARLHRFEMNTKFPSMFDYSKIDKLIAISPYIFEEFYRVANVPREKMQVIFNAIDVSKFDKDKQEESKFNIGMIGIVPKLKRLDRAIDIFEKVYEKDNRYKLLIKGKMPEEFSWVWNNTEERQYYEKIFGRIKQEPFGKNVEFEGWGDVSEWLQKAGYVLSVSDYESFHMAPIEGMVSGAKPLVLTREGVNTIFPKETIYNSLDEIAEAVLEGEKGDKEFNKQFVKNNYSLELVCSNIVRLMNTDEYL